MIKAIHVRDIRSPLSVRYSGRAFLSTTPYRGGYAAVYREFTPKRSNDQTDVYRQDYDSQWRLCGEPRLLLPNANDPRAFRHRNQTLCLCQVWKRGDNADCHQIIVDVDTGKIKVLAHSLEYGGKNWMPVTNADGHLWMIRSLQPLVVLRVEEDYSCKVVIEQQGEIGKMRGGAASWFISENEITGYGHLTEDDGHHEPFKFIIDLSAETVSFESVKIENPDYIMDPTSVWGNQMICACSKENWWVDQEITHRLFELRKETDHAGN